MDLSNIFSRPDVLAIAGAMGIPIVAIIVMGVSGVVKRLIIHRERMAMIEQGLHPDFPPEGQEGEKIEEDTDGLG